MLMGSTRPKTHIRRTSSMGGLSLSDHHHSPPPPSSAMIATDHDPQPPHHHHSNFSEINPASYDNYSSIFPASPRNIYSNPRRRNSDQFDSSFLRTCGFCRRRLAAARDLYMYKGDAAFCSFECREEQMKRDDESISED